MIHYEAGHDFQRPGEFTHKSEWPYKWQSSQGGWSKEPTYEELTTMVYDPKDLGSWLDSRNAELTVFHAWDDSYVGLESNDTIKHLVRFTYPATHPAGAFRFMGREGIEIYRMEHKGRDETSRSMVP